jgi:Na+-driven multidrug efflux pump
MSMLTQLNACSAHTISHSIVRLHTRTHSIYQYTAIYCYCNIWYCMHAGDPTATLKNGALVGIVNLILDPILMFPMGLGTAGAAIG